MALPQYFETPEEYFKESLNFFNEYQHLFNFANTDILVNNMLEQINVNSLEDMNIFDKEFDLKTVDDEYLNDFFTKLKGLSVAYDDIEEDNDLEVANYRLSPKKKHEIMYLAKEIIEMCENVECEMVVDFGSGLGYLDQHIFEITNYNVLGLECNETNYVGSKIRQRKYHENSREKVKYIKHKITEESRTNIMEYLNDKFPEQTGFCLTGLHACADLTVDSLNLFLKMADAKGLVLLSCCYHKMCEDAFKFKNFPLSGCLKRMSDTCNGFEFLKVPFLRLAAHPPSGQDSLNDMVFNLLARATLQLYASKRDCIIKRNKRKAVKIKTMDNNFENYINATTHGFTLYQNQLDDFSDKSECRFNLDEVRSMWNQISHSTFKKAAIFILLQNCLQPVIENFVSFDRLVYLKENGIRNCVFKKIYNENLSPRCLALLASK